MPNCDMLSDSLGRPEQAPDGGEHCKKLPMIVRCFKKMDCSGEGAQDRQPAAATKEAYEVPLCGATHQE
jgi:hypothetical protein